MRPLIRLEQRGKEWTVVMRSGRVEFTSNFYVKAVGVFDYLEAKRLASEAETIELRKRLKAKRLTIRTGARRT